ncbi:MAG: GlsB/YeaQ/YmgE family stress response membrane protein [Methylococcaceae bacterium]|nr:GlsB/YeaQ/YmgE family stress response membrane protein [Methylococcaceae bacterium]
MQGSGFGLLSDIIIGIVGAVVCGYLFGLTGISAGGGLIGSIVSATLGAIALLFLLRLVKRA